ncbi:MAG: peptide deformylase [Holosporaceae bacterium]
MALLTVLEEPDPRLRRKSAAVPLVDDTVRTHAQDMVETLKHLEGHGLAAPQVNILKRIVVYDLGSFKASLGDFSDPPHQMPHEIADDDATRFCVMINPEIIERSPEEEVLSENCFSVPLLSVPVKRPATIRVRFLDTKGQTHEKTADGYLSRCIQHEIDHLDGVLTIDYLSPLRKGMALRKLEKVKRNALAR